MPAWVCPECGRQFGRRKQGHECAPAMTIEQYFETGPPHERPIFEAVMAEIGDIGPIHVEPVSVGIFLKRARTFAQLRPMHKWVALSFSLPRQIRHRTVTRKVVLYGTGYWHVANLRRPEDFDEDLRDYVVEAYFASPD